MRRWIILSLLPLVAGCQFYTELDDAQFLMNQEHRKEVKSFLDTEKERIYSADEIAGQKHILQQQLIVRDTHAFIKEHTAADGTFAAPVDTVLAHMNARDLAIQEKMLSERVWKTLYREWLTDVQTMRLNVERVQAKDEQIQVTKKEFDTQLKSAIQMATLAGAVLVGVAF